MARLPPCCIFKLTFYKNNRLRRKVKYFPKYLLHCFISYTVFFSPLLFSTSFLISNSISKTKFLGSIPQLRSFPRTFSWIISTEEMDHKRRKGIVTDSNTHKGQKTYEDTVEIISLDDSDTENVLKSCTKTIMKGQKYDLKDTHQKQLSSAQLESDRIRALRVQYYQKEKQKQQNQMKPVEPETATSGMKRKDFEGNDEVVPQPKKRLAPSKNKLNLDVNPPGVHLDVWLELDDESKRQIITLLNEEKELVDNKFSEVNATNPRKFQDTTTNSRASTKLKRPTTGEKHGNFIEEQEDVRLSSLLKSKPNKQETQAYAAFLNSYHPSSNIPINPNIKKHSTMANKQTTSQPCEEARLPFASFGDVKKSFLHIVSYNVDGLDDKYLKTRTEEICAIMKECLPSHAPDVILLQEVIPESFRLFERLLQPEYQPVDKPSVPYFTSIFVRTSKRADCKSIKIVDSSRRAFACGSQMGRDILSVNIEVTSSEDKTPQEKSADCCKGKMTTQFTLVTSHLESCTESSVTRCNQFQEILNIIKAHDKEKPIIFAGDTNLRVKEVSQFEEVKVYKSVNKSQTGTKEAKKRKGKETSQNSLVFDYFGEIGSPKHLCNTWDLSKNTNKRSNNSKQFYYGMRFDRIYLNSIAKAKVPIHYDNLQNSNLEFPLDFLGTNPIARLNYFPSDHFGLSFIFEL